MDTIRRRISIPYGSIKSDFTSNGLPGKKAFQFLMVRLKAIGCTYFSSSKNISIPYGSIKSAFAPFVRFLPEISIPYGSIKSLQNCLIHAQCSISIPYGSIKSKPTVTYLGDI